METVGFSATENVSGMRSIRDGIRQSDEDIAVEILNSARNVQNGSCMVQRVATVIEKQKDS